MKRKKKKEEDSKKAQATMEFLMTYGWAILVVLICLGILAYTGVINVSMFLPEKFTINPGSGMHGDEFKADNINDITLRIKNFMNKDITVSRIEVVTGLEGVKEKCTYSGEQTISKDSSFDFPVKYDCNLGVGDKIRGTVEIEYSIGGGLTKKTTGSLVTYVHEAGEEVETCSDDTPYGQCSTTKPKYCDNGVLIDKCGTPAPECGCDEGYVCQEEGTCCEQPGQGIVLLMHMDELSGPTITDSSCNNYHGTANGVVYGEAGKFGTTALRFDSDSDYVEIFPGISDITGDLTVELWAKPFGWFDGDGWDYLVYSKGDHYKYEIGFHDSADKGYLATRFKLVNSLEDAYEVAVGSENALSLDEWHHLAFVREDNFMRLYIDGYLEDSRDDFPGPIVSGWYVSIGGYKDEDTPAFNGVIDEVTIYNRVLDDAEILAHFNQG